MFTQIDGCKGFIKLGSNNLRFFLTILESVVILFASKYLFNLFRMVILITSILLSYTKNNNKKDIKQHCCSSAKCAVSILGDDHDGSLK